VFLVGVVNTLLVSAIGIILATILGFLVGVARLSNNWLISKISLAYIEIFRNIPLLLQIFFWYFFVIRAMPSVRNSIAIRDLFFLTNRGLYMPKLHSDPGFMFVWIAIAVAIVFVIGWTRYANRKQKLTGKRPPVLWTNIAVLFGLPIIVFLLVGQPLHWS